MNGISGLMGNGMMMDGVQLYRKDGVIKEGLGERKEKFEQMLLDVKGGGATAKVESGVIEQEVALRQEVSGIGKRNGGVVGQFVDYVDYKDRVAQNEMGKVLRGESNNLIRAQLAAKESGVYFKLAVECRNKLEEGLKEVMRMQV